MLSILIGKRRCRSYTNTHLSIHDTLTVLLDLGMFNCGGGLGSDIAASSSDSSRSELDLIRINAKLDHNNQSLLD
jgi:hypothetical protein